MKIDKSVTWRRVAPQSLKLEGLRVAIIGGTGGIGRGLSRFLASRGAAVTVVGQTFRDSGISGIDFIKADLSLMREAKRVGERLPAETLDLVIFTTGIFAAPKRQETPEGIERDMAVSYLSRMVIIREMGARLGKKRPDSAPKPRVFVWGFPGTGQAGTIDDLNAEKSYGVISAHMNGIAGNEVLVLDSAKRYPNANFFGLNPGAVQTGIRRNLFGAHTVLFRLAEALIGLFSPNVSTYVERIAPLLVSPDLEQHSGAMFNKKGQAILPTPKLTDISYEKEFMAASEKLVSRAKVQLAS